MFKIIIVNWEAYITLWFYVKQGIHTKKWQSATCCVCVSCSQGAAVLWLQHHPGTAVRGRGLLQPRGHHLCPLTQRLQTPFLHQNREQWVDLREQNLMTNNPKSHSLLFVLSLSEQMHLCIIFSWRIFMWGRLLNHDGFSPAFHCALA